MNPKTSFTKALQQKKQSGQVLVEFILLFIVMVSTSLILLKAINGNIGARWEAAVKLITSPPDQEIQLR